MSVSSFFLQKHDETVNQKPVNDSFMASPSSSGILYPPVPECTCCCDCYEGAGGKKPTTAGVRNSTGAWIGNMFAADLGQIGHGGYNTDFGSSLEYSNLRVGASGIKYGIGWSNHELPFLNYSGEDVVFQGGSAQAVYFQKTATGFRPMYFVRDTLELDDAAGIYTLTAPTGEKKTFFKESGLLRSMKDKYGSETVFDYVDEELLSVTLGEGGVSYHYTWNSFGQLDTVTLRVGDPEDVASNIRRTVYVYTEAHELEQVTLQKWEAGGWVDIENSYYRYFSDEEHAPGLVRFAVGKAAYEQMRSANPLWPQEADDATLAEYADREFDYYANWMVRTLKTNGGKYVYEFEYGATVHSGSSPNVCTAFTSVTQPDGSIHTHYFNWAGNELLLEVSKAGQKWYPICQQFDGNARVVLKAVSSAVQEVDISWPHLFELKETSGLNTVLQYDSYGNLVLTGFRNGSLTTLPIFTQMEATFDAHWVNGVAVWVNTSRTVYRVETAVGVEEPVTTYFEYEWHQVDGVDTAQVKKMTTILPAVAVAENGDGETGSTESHYDEWGFLTKQVNEVGTVTTYEYYLDNGAIKRMVEDAGTGHMNLTTDYAADATGRTTESLGPVHEISFPGASSPTAIRRAQWTQYLDAVDEVRTINGYLRESDSSSTTINPVQISRHDVKDTEVAGGRVTQEIAAVYSGSGVPEESTTFAQSDWVRLSTQHFDIHNELTHSRVYHLIPASDVGSNGTNYGQTDYAYDSAGRQNQVTSPEGTIQQTVFNTMGWQIESKVGTTLANLVTTQVQQYDQGEDQGDGLLSMSTVKVDGDAAKDRVRTFDYDWRNRQNLTVAAFGTAVFTINLVQRFYDNRNNVIQVREYRNAIEEMYLLNRAESFFDSRNRMYRSKRYGVNVSPGSTVYALTSNTYFDQAGRVIRNTPAGKKGYTVSHYDVLGRVTKSFFGYGDEPDSHSPWNPGSIAGSVVMEQSEAAFDDAGNQISTVVRQRFDDAAGNGELGNPTTEPKARVSYGANYPDALGRTQAAANFGTNKAEAWTRPPTVPERSDTVLVTSFAYNQAGEQAETMDPMGTVLKREYDQAGRQLKTIENYISGGGGASDVNKTTDFEYNLDNNLVKLTAVNATTGNQITQWIYGVTVAQGSSLESNGLIYQKVYPDSTGPSDRVTFEYNAVGQSTAMTDQAGTRHEYDYDKFGRLTDDRVETLGSGVDGTIRRIRRGYDSRGMLSGVTSFNASGLGANEVHFLYNAYSQLTEEIQEGVHINYEYASGSENTIRRTGIVYPWTYSGGEPTESTRIAIAYDGVAANALGRPSAIKEDDATLCSYRYLGAAMFIGVKYEAASDVELTYQDGSDGDDSDGGDKYTGLDRFGRLVETLWKKGSADQVRSKYGRNRFGGVVWRRDVEAHSQGVDTEDNYYWYDGLYQVKQHQRGDLAGTPPNYTGITGVQKEENWDYDATGNWNTYEATNPFNVQGRTHNEANEITLIESAPGNVAPAFDPAGNMLTLPKNPGISTGQYMLKWDAWNRLVEVKEGSTLVASYTYDGLTRRLTKTIATETRRYYYNDQWRPLEERVQGASVAVDQQYVWGLRDRWDLFRRQRTTAGSELNETHHCLRDYLDPVAIVGTDGDVGERFAFDTFGNTRLLASDFSERPASDFGWEFLFHAEFRDGRVGFYNYGYRYYDAMLGKWLSRDPAEEVDSANLYSFVLNSPANRVDYYGLQTDALLFAIEQESKYVPVAGPGLLSNLFGYDDKWDYSEYIMGLYFDTLIQVKLDFIDFVNKQLCKMPAGTQSPAKFKRKEAIGSKERFGNDLGQSWNDRGVGLGNFYFELGSVNFTFTGSSKKWTENGKCCYYDNYLWFGEILAKDDPGFNYGDFGFIPFDNSRNVTRGKFQISGMVNCKRCTVFRFAKPGLQE